VPASEALIDIRDAIREFAGESLDQE